MEYLSTQYEIEIKAYKGKEVKTIVEEFDHMPTELRLKYICRNQGLAYISFNILDIVNLEMVLIDNY